MLGQIQELLQSIYEIEVAPQVGDFVVTDPALLAGSVEDLADTPEALLVRSGPDGLDISLYLAAGLLERLEARNPLEGLDAENLADFCLALEGVSHFLYLIWRAQHARPVSLLELEMQAEVDKYTTAVLLWEPGEDDDAGAPEVHRRLFDECRFDPRLDPEALARYRRASRYAGRYCRHLQRESLSPEALLRELRRFYRLPQPRKIRHIESGRTH